MLVIAIAVKLETSGPSFYHHQRIGKNGRPFNILKFRSMVKGGDDKEYMDYLKDLIETERSGAGQAKPYRKMNGDTRVTRVGQFIRKYYFDEIPQFWNILKGEMSLVGPRPHVQFEVDYYTPEQRRRLIVRPGATGLWQVAGKADCTFNELIQIDLWYIDHWSLGLDFRIILRTIIVMASGGGDFWTRMEKRIPGKLQTIVRKMRQDPFSDVFYKAVPAGRNKPGHFPGD
jgi:lipopolysaccharide/colanic/teichoic acid biosynthesis glycosyltransferase